MLCLPLHFTTENKLVWEECAEGTGCIGLKWIRPSTESSQPLLCAAYKHGGIKLYQLQCNGEMSLNLLTGLHIDQEVSLDEIVTSLSSYLFSFPEI